MQTIIQNKLSEMLDELLEKALKEKPSRCYPRCIYWNGLEFYIEHYNIENDVYFVFITIFGREREFSVNNKQKQLIKKIFQKWSNTNDTNSK